MANPAPVVDRIRIIPRPDDFLDRNVGSSGEVFFNKLTNSLRVYSGRDQAGFELARADLDNISNADFLAKATAAGVGGGGGVSGGASVDVSDTAPTSPEDGNIWFNSTNGRIYVYVTDADSSQWVQPSVPASSVDTFNEIDVTGSNTLTASGSETLTVAGGANITVTSDASTNTITISAAGAAQQDLDTITTAGATTTNDITVGSLTSTGAVTANSLDINGTGAVEFDSASSITLTAPDGVVTSADLTVSGSLDLSAGASINEFSTDGTLAGDSDTAVPTEAAVKTYVDSAISGFVSGDDTSFTGVTTFTTTTDITNAKTGATGIVEHDYTEGAVWYHTSVSANFTPNFTNIPTTDNRTINVVLVIEQGGTAYGPSSVSVNGANYTPLIVGAGNLSYNANQTDIVSFTFIRTGGAWKVLASVNTYG
jgi:hypothetical protein